MTATPVVAELKKLGTVRTRSMRPVLPWWSIVVANGGASLLAGAYLLHAHPGLWGRLLHRVG